MQLVFVSSLVLAASVVILSVGLLRSRAQAETHARGGQPTTNPDWSELIASMGKMHMAMEAVERSGNADVDFVRLIPAQKI